MSPPEKTYEQGYLDGWRFAETVIEKSFARYFEDFDKDARAVLRIAHKRIKAQFDLTGDLLIPEIQNLKQS